MTTEEQQIINLCLSMFDGAVGKTYLDDLALFVQNNPTQNLEDALAFLPDFSNQFSGLNTNEKVTDYLLNLYNASNNELAKDFFLTNLNAGYSKATLMKMAGEYLASENVDSSLIDSSNTFKNKLDVATHFSVNSSIKATAVSDLKNIVSSVTENLDTVAIVKSVIDIAKTDTNSLSNLTTTITTVKELITTYNQDAAILHTVLSNVKTMLTTIATDVITTTTTININSTMQTISTVVKATKNDATFISYPTTIASKVTTDATALQKEAAAKIPINELSDIFGDDVPTDLSDVALSEDGTPTTPTIPVIPPVSGGGGGGITIPTPTTPIVTTQTIDVSTTGHHIIENLDTTFNFAAENYVYEILGFGQGDSLNFINTANPTVVNTNFSDEQINIQWAYNGNIVVVELTVPNSEDARVTGIESFKNLYGSNSISNSISSGNTTYTASSNQSIDVASSNAIIYLTEDTYTYQIANFNDGDILDFPDGANPTVVNTNFNDGNITLQWAANGNVITANLTIPTADDATIIGVSSFEAAFGADSIA